MMSYSSVCGAAAAVCALFLSVSRTAHCLQESSEVSFQAALCAPNTAPPCASLDLVYKNPSELAWSLSDAVDGGSEVDVVDVAQGDLVLATLNGRNGTLSSAEGGEMTVKELSSHFCMGHIFASYEGELYRIDPTTDGCDALMDGGMDMDMDVDGELVAAMAASAGFSFAGAVLAASLSSALLLVCG